MYQSVSAVLVAFPPLVQAVVGLNPSWILFLFDLSNFLASGLGCTILGQLGDFIGQLGKRSRLY